MQNGGILKEVNVAYETCGVLSERRDNAIFICHALTGDAHVAGRHAGDVKLTGWWSSMVCPGGGIDTDKFYVVCANILGGCSGTTGPSSINPDTGEPYGSAFPAVTVADIVTVHKMLLEQLGFDGVYAVVGGSFGGMQALEFCARFPGFAKKCITIASGASLTAQALAFDVIGAEAIKRDKNWRGGDYYCDGNSPVDGLTQARQLAHVTYLSREHMDRKFAKRCHGDGPLDETGEMPPPGVSFEGRPGIISYLRHQGEKFIRRFDANSYLSITGAMDSYRLGDGFGSLTESVSRINSKMLIVALSGDWLFYPSQSEELTSAMLEAGKDVSYFCLNAPAGHDSFLMASEIGDLRRVVSGFLTRLPEKPDGGDVPADDRRDHDELVKMLPEGVRSVLDVACGGGSLIYRITEACRDVSCTGVDINCGSAVSVLRAGSNAVLADVDTGLGIIPSNCFDCVVLSESLQVMRRPDHVIDEILRIAPQGIVSFPNFGMWSVRLSFMLRGRMPKTRRLPYEWYDTPNIHLCTIKDFFDYCRERRIKVEKVSYMTTLTLSRIFVSLGMKNFGASRVLVKISRPDA